MRKNFIFVCLQFLFAAVLSSALVISGCSRTNSGTDPSPPGGEIIFAYNVDLIVVETGASSDRPLWYDKGITMVEAVITFKANPGEPVSGVPVDFIVSGGGVFYDYETGGEIGRAARVYTNDSGIAILYYVTVGETVPTTKIVYNQDTGKYEEYTYDKAIFGNQTVTGCVDEANIGNKYSNCKTATIFITGPIQE